MWDWNRKVDLSSTVQVVLLVAMSPGMFITVDTRRGARFQCGSGSSMKRKCLSSQFKVTVSEVYSRFIIAALTLQHSCHF